MTTRFLVLADTHIPRRVKKFPPEVLDCLGRADAIVHLGDFTQPEVLATLQEYAPVFGVHGNNDDEALRRLLPGHRTLTVDGHTLVLVHGDVGGRTALTAARSVDGGDAVLFGHSHRPYCSVEGGRLLFNPGSPTDRRFGPYRSYGWLEIGERIRPRIVPLV